jgi:hypothetical protein
MYDRGSAVGHVEVLRNKKILYPCAVDLSANISSLAIDFATGFSSVEAIEPKWPKGKDISEQMCTAITPAIDYVNTELKGLLGAGVASCACDDNVRY